MNRPAVAIELRDLTAAADLIEALRGTPPANESAARRRQQLADRLDQALFARLITPKERT
jgi:hypothetical protein